MYILCAYLTYNIHNSFDNRYTRNKINYYRIFIIWRLFIKLSQFYIYYTFLSINKNFENFIIAKETSKLSFNIHKKIEKSSEIFLVPKRTYCYKLYKYNNITIRVDIFYYTVDTVYFNENIYDANIIRFTETILQIQIFGININWRIVDIS